MSRLSNEIRQYCSDNLLKLNTDLGQHFLVDEMVLDDIVTAGNIQETDHIVEIGPGVGVLTRELLYNAGKVTAVEISLAVENSEWQKQYEKFSDTQKTLAEVRD